MNKQESEELLCHYERVVLTLHECHKKNAFLYKKLSNFLTVINIILGTITGTSSISIYKQDSPTYQLINIILIYIITLLTSCQKILEPSKKYERFRNASQEYLTLFYEIKYKTIFELTSDDDLKQYVKQLNLKLEDMRIKFPFINDKIYDNCKQQVSRKLNINTLNIQMNQ